MVKKWRRSLGPTTLTKTTTWANGKVNTVQSIANFYTNYSALLISEGHDFKRRRYKNAGDWVLRRDLGGPFQVGSIETTFNLAKVMTTPYDDTHSLGTWTVTEGDLCPSVMPATNPTAASIPAAASGSSMAAAGTIAISRCSPVNPSAGLGQFLGELKDLPSLKVKVLGWKPKTHGFMGLAKRGSDDFLNEAFGWVPFIGDLKDTVKAIQNKDKILQQYHRDADRTVRRSYHFPVDVSTTTTINSNASYGNMPTAVVQHPGVESTTITTETKIWFSGGFTYLVPKLGTVASIQADANKLLGLRLDPWLLYQLAPWSWALDWITSVGAVVHNANQFLLDGLVLRYGYVMRTQTITETRTLSGILIRGEPSELSSSWTTVKVIKDRVRATPFGFGLNPTSFTNRQWAIVAALGISRAPRSLNS